MADVALVSCVAKKLAVSAPARDLYCSGWFRLARAWCEACVDRWYILSAKYQLVPPELRIAPYNVTLVRQGIEARILWAERVVGELLPRVAPESDRLIVLAGRAYREPMVALLAARGYRVAVPMAGLGIGQQMAWLKRKEQINS
jgi:hypothetical protein